MEGPEHKTFMFILCNQNQNQKYSEAKGLVSPIKDSLHSGHSLSLSLSLSLSGLWSLLKLAVYSARAKKIDKTSIYDQFGKVKQRRKTKTHK